MQAERYRKRPFKFWDYYDESNPSNQYWLGIRFIKHFHIWNWIWGEDPILGGNLLIMIRKCETSYI